MDMAIVLYELDRGKFYHYWRLSPFSSKTTMGIIFFERYDFLLKIKVSA